MADCQRTPAHAVRPRRQGRLQQGSAGHAEEGRRELARPGREVRQVKETMMSSPAIAASSKPTAAPVLIVDWICRIVAAIILLQTLFFKFAAAPESVYIFTKLGAFIHTHVPIRSEERRVGK